MQHLSKLIFFVTTLFSCSMALFGMSQLGEDLSLLSEAELIGAFDDHHAATQTLLEKRDDSSDDNLSESLIDDSDDDRATLERIEKNNKALRKRVLDGKTAREGRKQIRDDRRADRQAMRANRHVSRQKSSTPFFSYIKWTVLCAGVFGPIVYYLYSHKNKPVPRAE